MIVSQTTIHQIMFPSEKKNQHFTYPLLQFQRMREEENKNNLNQI